MLEERNPGRFPVLPSAEGPVLPSQVDGGSLLVVDDSAFSRQILCRQLTEVGFQTTDAANGKAALHLLKEEPFDLVLLDVVMPEMDGISALKAIRQLFTVAELPVIMVTARGDSKDIVAALACGANDYVTKPVSLPVVTARVKTQLLLKRMVAALEKANKKLADLSYLDGLTSIANRRSFDECLGREWRRAGREGTPLALILADLDSFKTFNDTYGHEAGDKVLREVAKALEEAAERGGDVVARYGGEEFAAVLPETDAEGALVVAERMRQTVAQLQIPHASSRVTNFVTISAGVASAIPSPSLSTSDLIAAADKALYVSKRKGCNQVQAITS